MATPVSSAVATLLPGAHRHRPRVQTEQTRQERNRLQPEATATIPQPTSTSARHARRQLPLVLTATADHGLAQARLRVPRDDTHGVSGPGPARAWSRNRAEGWGQGRLTLVTRGLLFDHRQRGPGGWPAQGVAPALLDLHLQLREGGRDLEGRPHPCEAWGRAAAARRRTGSGGERSPTCTPPLRALASSSGPASSMGAACGGPRSRSEARGTTYSMGMMGRGLASCSSPGTSGGTTLRGAGGGLCSAAGGSRGDGSRGASSVGNGPGRGGRGWGGSCGEKDP